MLPGKREEVSPRYFGSVWAGGIELSLWDMSVENSGDTKVNIYVLNVETVLKSGLCVKDCGRKLKLEFLGSPTK